MHGFYALGLYTSSDQDCERGTYAQGRYVGPSEIKDCPSIRNEREVWHSSEGLLYNYYYVDDVMAIKKFGLLYRGETCRRALGRADFLSCKERKEITK